MEEVWNKAAGILDQARSGLLAHEAAAELLELVGLRAARWKLCRSAEEAVEAARRLGWPVVLKVASPDVVHKSDVGGVVVGIEGAEAVRAAYERILAQVGRRVPEARLEGVTVHEMLQGPELVLGASRDPQFGPVVMVGVGGVLVELYRDVAFRVAPFEVDEALAAVSELKGQKLLEGFRGLPAVDRQELAGLMVGLGRLMLAESRIAEVDVNPLVGTERGLVAADLRVVVRSEARAAAGG